MESRRQSGLSHGVDRVKNTHARRGQTRKKNKVCMGSQGFDSMDGGETVVKRKNLGGCRKQLR